MEHEHEQERRERETVLRLIIEDYDRRRQSRWGRFLLWLLRRTT